MALASPIHQMPGVKALSLPKRMDIKLVKRDWKRVSLDVKGLKHRKQDDMVSIAKMRLKLRYSEWVKTSDTPKPKRQRIRNRLELLDRLGIPNKPGVPAST